MKLSKLFNPKQSLLSLLLYAFFLAGAFSLAMHEWVHQNLVVQGFTTLQREAVLANGERVYETLDRETEYMAQMAHDWGTWDDTYEFVQDTSADYINSNLGVEALVYAKLNFLGILDSNGKVIWSMSIDQEEEAEVQDSILSQTSFAAHHPFVWNSKTILPNQDLDALERKGILSTEHGNLIVATVPILNSAGEGPIRGSFVLGVLVQEVLEKIQKQTKVPFQTMPFPYTEPKDSLPTPQTLQDRILFSSADSMHMRFLFPDIDQKPLFAIHFSQHSSLLQRGMESAVIVRWLLIGINLLSLLGLALLIHFRVLWPVSRISQHMSKISQSGTLVEPLSLNREDEIGELGRDFNIMTDELEKSRQTLYKASITDGLTRLHNRAHIMELLQMEVDRSRRYKFPIGIGIFDIDHFKNINDTYGHQTGDEVLREVSTALRNSLRDSDFVGRYGGEEFLVVFTHQDETGIKDAAERVRQGIEELQFKNQDLVVTVSGGVTTLKAHSIKEAIAIADGCLYRAKKEGRNRINSSD